MVSARRTGRCPKGSTRCSGLDPGPGTRYLGDVHTRGSARPPGSAAGASARPARTVAPAEPAAHVLRLQATAGNRAVSGLLGVQRDPDTPTTQPSVAARIAEAREHLTKGEFDDPRSSTTGPRPPAPAPRWSTCSGRTSSTWSTSTRPAAGLTAKAEQKAVRDFTALLRARVTTALNAKLHALAVQVATSAKKDKTLAEQVEKTLAGQIETSFADAPMWGEGTITDRLFAQWVGPVPITGRSPAGASELWRALRAASAAAVASKRGTKLAKTALAGLDGAELGAVRTRWTRARPGWSPSRTPPT